MKKRLGIPSIKEIIDEGLRPQLEGEVIRMARVINQRFYKLEKENLNKGSYAYKQAIEELGKEKPRYTTNKNKIAKTPLERLYRQYMELYVKEYSATSLVSGVRRINEKRITTATDKINYLLRLKLGEAGVKKMGGEISKEEFIEFLDNGGGELINNKYLDSEQIIEDWVEATKNGNISTKEFIREFKRYRKNKIDYGQVRRNLKRLRERKMKRGNKK